MVSRELITELAKISEMFEWVFQSRGGPMVERRAVPRLHVRGKLKDDPENVVFDPIGAVCFARTGLMFSEDYWVEAALSVGLSVADARDVIAASNDMTWRTVGDHREPDPYKTALRKGLLEATKLEVESFTR